MRDIAYAAGVSVMTVSRALRNMPKVAPATRQRILDVAETLGYRPDPDLARLMERVRSKKGTSIHAAIAVIREYVPVDDLLTNSYQFVSLKDIRSRALAYGYEVEEFWLGRDGLTPQRLQKILDARGIEGVIVSPQSTQLPCAEIDYSPFAAVTFGFGMRDPALHICITNMTLGIDIVARNLADRGYRRIGVAVTRWIVNRSQFGYGGGLFHFQQDVPPENRVPLLMLPHNEIRRGHKAFADWMKEHKPDVVISFDTHVPGWLKRMGLRIPDDIGFVVHDWTPKMTGMAGIYHRRDHIAAAAVDLVVTQLSQNERGVPAFPRQIMVPPEWIEGPSVRS